MAQSLFERLFPGEQRQRVAFHIEIAARLLETGRLLDLGCGTNAELADYRTDQREVWGADIQAHPQLRHAEWFRLIEPGGRIPFPSQHFDLVAACWVLEHVEHPARFMAEVARVLRPGGSLIALTISNEHYVTWVLRVVGLLPEAVTHRLVTRLYQRRPLDHFRTYYRLNSIRQLAAACRGTSLEVERIARFADQGYFGFSTIARTCATLLDRSLDQLSEGRGRVYMTVVCHKR